MDSYFNLSLKNQKPVDNTDLHQLKQHYTNSIYLTYEIYVLVMQPNPNLPNIVAVNGCEGTLFS